MNPCQNPDIHWSDIAWSRSKKIYEAILEQPFIKELAAGTLPEEKFARYLAQDELYIGNYCKKMHGLSEQLKAEGYKADAELLMEFAVAGEASEQEMHQLLIDRFQIDTNVEMAVTTKAYLDHLQAAIDSGDVGVGLAAQLPCAWIYNEVGIYIKSIATLEGNPYREWIEMYGDEMFTKGTEDMIAAVDRQAERKEIKFRHPLTLAYLKSSLYEYAFWDFGYRGYGEDYSYMEDLKSWVAKP